MLLSVIIRTYNEEKFLNELLTNIAGQTLDLFDLEIIIVDSGSTDNTLIIAKKYNCRITSIEKKDFTFGRSLNIGCSFSKGEILVFISGHCIPTTKSWLRNLVDPLVAGISKYSYGKQEGRSTTKFSEQRLFDKYFPDYSKKPQNGFFCNNANSALIRNIWEKYEFNEDLTGLEDMYLAKQLVNDGYTISYIADASVFHIHDESWRQIRIRYEREAVALQKIMPDVHFHFFDFINYLCIGVFQDLVAANKQKMLIKYIKQISMFRIMQYWGACQGHREHRKISKEMKYRYFYPADIERDHYEKKNSRAFTHEGKQ